ncbi:MAG TPA: response regulator [Polyangia bacterium]|nr:response regulator [Polyangia bacterium]
MLVEDDANIRDALGQLLRVEGYSVLAASNGREGLDLLARLPERPSLILLDLMMPHVDGWEFLELLGRNRTMAGIPVIVVSAYINRAKLLSAATLGEKPICFLKKPLDFKRLLEMVRRYSQPDQAGAC